MEHTSQASLKEVAKYGKHPSITAITMAMMAFTVWKKKWIPGIFFNYSQKCDNFVSNYKKLLVVQS